MRPSEVIAGLRAQLAAAQKQRVHAVNLLTAHGIEFVPMPDSLSDLTEQEHALVVILSAAEPGATIDSYDLLEALPSRHVAADRDVKLVDVLACRVRRKLGDARCIENVKGVGYRLGPALHQQLTGVAA